MAGGAIGATVLSAASSSAATTTTTTTPSRQGPPGGGPGPGYGPTQGGTFHSNETAAHEKTESAQREAQESAGQVPTVP
jgi:hypothetical protein